MVRRVRGISNTRRNSKDCSEPPEPPMFGGFFIKHQEKKNYEKNFNRNHNIFELRPGICHKNMHD